MRTLVVDMKSVIFICLVIAVVSLQNVNADRYEYPSIRYNHYGRPVVLVSSQSGVARTYVHPPITQRDASHAPDSEKVRLDVYYATDCPDSMRFITSQLYPLYQEMGDVMDIHLVPYGKTHATFNEDTQRYDFRCQHGPSECFGNTVQSCAMSLYPKERDYLNFINCMEKYPRPSRSGKKCARRNSLDWDKIEKCARGDEGNRLQHKMSQKTDSLNPRLYFIPWVVVDEVFSESKWRMALRDLKGVICKSYKGTHPKCQQGF